MPASSLTSPQLHLVAQEFPEALHGIEQLTVGGDVLSPTHVVTMLTHLPDTRIVDTYGPTECCIDATSFVLDGVAGDTRIPIGRPLANSTAYVLDPQGRPCPIGVPGELYVGGDGVARCRGSHS